MSEVLKSAVIYNFPALGHRTPVLTRSERVGPVMNVPSPSIASESGWYHEDALRESESTADVVPIRGGDTS